MFERIVLGLSALIWLPYGVYCFFVPEVLAGADSAGVVASTPTAVTEIRAMYGGLQAAIGALAVAALMRPRLASGVLLSLVFITGGLASTRLMGLLMDGGFSAYTGGGLGFEIVSCAAALLALRQGGTFRVAA